MKRTRKTGKSPKRRIVEGIERAAAQLKVPSAMVKLAKKSGAPGFLPGSRIDADVLGKWLSEQSPPRPAEADVRTPMLDEGPGANLKRLETEERLAHMDYVAARASGNPLLVELTADRWVKLSEQRRRVGVSTREHMKGDMVATGAVIECFQDAIAYLTTHAASIEDRIGYTVCLQAKDASAAEEIRALLRDEQNCLLTSVRHVHEVFIAELKGVVGDTGQRIIECTVEIGRVMAETVRDAFGRLESDARRRPISGDAVARVRDGVGEEFERRLAETLSLTGKGGAA